MIYSKELTDVLEDIVTKNVAMFPLPYKKGNSIRLKHLAIRKNKHGYQLFDCKTNAHVVRTFTKTAALAIANCIVRNKEKSIDFIQLLDEQVRKYYNDAIFYKNSVEKTQDPIKKEVCETRFDIATEDAYVTLQQIENYIFDK